MGMRIEDRDKQITNRLANWHLDAWDEFLRLDDTEQEIWRQLCQNRKKGNNALYILPPKKAKKNKKEKAVRCINNKKVYKSLDECAKAFHCSRHTIYHSIKYNAVVLRRYKFEFFKES